MAQRMQIEMKGGNGATSGSGITHSPSGEQTAEKCAYQNDEAGNVPWMDSALGVLLDGLPSRKRGSPKNLENVKVPSVPLDRGFLSRQKIIDPLVFF